VKGRADAQYQAVASSARRRGDVDPLACSRRRRCEAERSMTPPKDARTKPPGARTGYKNPGCYARALSDCSAKLTQEHVVSKNFLKRLEAPTGFFDGYGVPLGPGQFPPFKASSASLSPKVLCERHNNALSPLDEAMGKALARLTDAALEFATGRSPKPWLHVVNGHDLERWCLKLLCGGSRGAILQGAGFDPTSWLPPSQWLDVLFGERRLAPPLGLYFAGSPGIIGTRAQIELLPLLSNGAPVGIGLGLSGFLFFFAASPVAVRAFPPPASRERTYRLGDIRIRNERTDTEKVVSMRWRPGEAEPTSVSVSWFPPAPAAPPGLE
jgi:hypothetical protein